MKKYTSLNIGANRHLIVGDIHGQYDLLMELLRLAKYNVNEDILYTVGDMIDRGKQSWEVVEFFHHPRRFSILGNHEAMALDDCKRALWKRNGGNKTIKSLYKNNKTLKMLRDIIEELPLVLEVNNKFRLVHAEFPVRLTEDLIKVKLENEDTYFEESCLWGRNDIYAIQQGYDLSKTITANQPMPTFVGHSVVEDVLTVGTRTYLNLRMGELACIDAITGEVFRTPKIPRNIDEVLAGITLY